MKIASQSSKLLSIANPEKATLLGSRVELADTSFTRLVGLAGRRSLPAGGGLLIRPSSGVHTFGMRFPIDVVALNKSMQVVGLWRKLPPLRITGLSTKIHSMLELPPGVIDESSLEIGDRVDIRPAIEA